MASTDSVKVALRIRPQNERELAEKCKICTHVSENKVDVGGDKSFSYDHVFNISATQSDVYKECIENLIESVFNGLNATVLAYGQTGSGKSYTMGTTDTVTQPEIVGIIPRAVSHLFQMINSLKQQAKDRNEDEPRFNVEVQFIELHNEDLIDLLSTDRNTNVKIHEEADSGQIVIKNAKKLLADTAEKVLNILKFGTSNRTTGFTNMNKQSSRSHAIFSMYVKQEKYEAAENDEKVLTKLSSKLHFVDLAGSERLKRTRATGDRAKEGISINCGLLALGNVICALTDPKKSHVPYRDSKLTRLLQDSLGGNSQTLMIACVSPSDIDCTETLNTMAYASRAKGIQNRIVINRDYETQQISQLKSEISRLQNELRASRRKSSKASPHPINVEELDSGDLEMNIIEDFKSLSDAIVQEFKTRAGNAMDDKVEANSLILLQEELNDLIGELQNGIQESLNGLPVPSRTKRSCIKTEIVPNTMPQSNTFDREKLIQLLLSANENTTKVVELLTANTEELPENAQTTETGQAQSLAEQLAIAQQQNRNLEVKCNALHNKYNATTIYFSQALSALKEEMVNSVRVSNES